METKISSFLPENISLLRNEHAFDGSVKGLREGLGADINWDEGALDGSVKGSGEGLGADINWDEGALDGSRSEEHTSELQSL